MLLGLDLFAECLEDHALAGVSRSAIEDQVHENLVDDGPILMQSVAQLRQETSWRFRSDAEDSFHADGCQSGQRLLERLGLLRPFEPVQIKVATIRVDMEC